MVILVIAAKSTLIESFYLPLGFHREAAYNLNLPENKQGIFDPSKIYFILACVALFGWEKRDIISE